MFVTLIHSVVRSRRAVGRFEKTPPIVPFLSFSRVTELAQLSVRIYLVVRILKVLSAGLKMKTSQLVCIYIAALSLLATPVSGFQGSDSTARLQSSVHRMTAWLGAGENSQQWRQFLLLNKLDTQSALGDQADIATLQAILGRFEMDVDGVDNPAFVDVRNRLREQVEFLSQRSVYDIQGAIDDAEFVPISGDKLEQYRQQTVFEYKSLQNYYRDKMASRNRAELFYEIELPDTIDFLSELEIEEFVPEVVIKIPGPDDGEDDSDSQSDEDEKTAKELAERKREVVIRLRSSVAALAKKNFQLNDPYVTSTRLSVEKLLSAFVYATNSKAESYFDREIKKLAENIDGLEDPAETAKHAIVGDSIGRLQSMGQMPHLVSAIRARYSLPNVRLSISADMVNKILSRKIVQAQPVNELVLGRLIRGHAVSQGSVDLEFVDDPNQAQISIHLGATINSQTHSVQYPFTAFTSSFGTVDARRNIFLNTSGFFANEPTGNACLSSNFQGVDSSSRLVNKIAVKKYNEDKARSEKVGADRALKQALDEFTKETNAIVAGRESSVLEKIEPYAGLLPEMRLRTTSEHLLVFGHRASAFGLAAHQEPPASFVTPDVGIKIHETLLTNYFTPYFSGKTFSNKEIAEKIVEIFGAAPEGLGPETESDEFSIVFDTVQPIRFIFRENRLGVAISGKRFRQGKKNIDTALVISMNFKIVRKDGKLFLKQDGEASVDYGTPRRKNARNTAFKNTLAQLINDEDRDELNQELPNDLIPAEDFEFDNQGIVENLKLVQFSISEGWLQVGWDYRDSLEFYSTLTDTPAIQSELIIKGTVDEYTPAEGELPEIQPIDKDS